MAETRPLRIGILGAAGITPEALIEPASQNADVRLEAVAARDGARAEEFAKQHSIKRVVASYDELVNDAEVDAVYIPLPNGFHGRWTIAALEAGTHVLVEKPFASNLAEAELVADVAKQHPDQVVMEGYHYRHHPFVHELQRLLSEGTIGQVTEASATFDITLPDRSDIRYNQELAGGATMDLGCYSVHLLRTLFGEPEVTSATARTTEDPRLDDALSAQLVFPSGIKATAASSLNEAEERQHVVIQGTKGTIEAEGFVKPQYGNWIKVTTSEGTKTFEARREPSTYALQLAAFVAAVRDGAEVITDVADSVATMRVIDQMYRAAGLEPRPVPPA